MPVTLTKVKLKSYIICDIVITCVQSGTHCNNYFCVL